MDFAKLFNRYRPAPKGEDIAGFVVHERGSGALVHAEYFDSSRMSDKYVADKIVSKREKLEKKYAPSRYDVEGGLFNNKAAFARFFPAVNLD